MFFLVGWKNPILLLLPCRLRVHWVDGQWLGVKIRETSLLDMFSPIFVVWAGIEFLYPINDLTSLLMLRQSSGPIRQKPRLEALPGVLGNRGSWQFISGEQGNTGKNF